MEVAAPEYKWPHWSIYTCKSLWPGHFCLVFGVHIDKDSSVCLWMLKCVSYTTCRCIPHSFCIWTDKSSQWNHFSSRAMVNCVMPSCLWCPYYSFCCSSGSLPLLTWQPQGTCTCSSSPDYMCVLCVCVCSYISTWFVVVFCMPHVGRADWLIDWLIPHAVSPRALVTGQAERGRPEPIIPIYCA